MLNAHPFNLFDNYRWQLILGVLLLFWFCFFPLWFCFYLLWFLFFLLFLFEFSLRTVETVLMKNLSCELHTKSVGILLKHKSSSWWKGNSGVPKTTREIQISSNGGWLRSQKCNICLLHGRDLFWLVGTRCLCLCVCARFCWPHQIHEHGTH